MKKQMLIKAMLILLPVLALGLATTVDSVTVFDTVSGETSYYSYFAMVPVENLQLVTPLAGLFSLICGILAVIHLVAKKDWALTGSRYCAFLAAVAAAIPVAIRGTVLVIPNVGFPILMLAQYGVAYFVGKQTSRETNDKKVSRLKR